MTFDMFLHCLGAMAMQAAAAIPCALIGFALAHIVGWAALPAILWAACVGAALAAGPTVWWWRDREFDQALTKASHHVNAKEWLCTIPATILFACALGAAAWSF